MTTTTAQRPMLNTTQSLALSLTLTGIRPEWDTPENGQRLTSLGSSHAFPDAAGFAHVRRAAV